MAYIGEEFDAGSVDAQQYDVLPAGWYTASIVGAELRTTKSGNGRYIAVQYRILGPTHQNRVVYGNLNIRNQNADAERIGREQLGSLCIAIGMQKLKDTDELAGRSVQIKLKVRQSEQYGDSNDVAGFKAVSGSAPPPAFSQPPTQPPAPAQPPRTSAAPPWSR